MIGKIGFNFAPFQKSSVNKNIASRNVSFGIKSHTEPVFDPYAEKINFVKEPPSDTYLVEGDLDALRPVKTPDQKEQDDKANTNASKATLEAAEEDQQRYQGLVGNCEV
jgi:hypothetical protein